MGHWCQGMREAAIADIRKAVTMGGGPIALADLGCMLGRLGRKAEAEKVLEELDELGKRVNVLPTYVGIVHASLGNHDAAFTYF
jgi:tetratricopeptide repeat protein